MQFLNNNNTEEIDSLSSVKLQEQIKSKIKLKQYFGVL